jgi:hypothetical protein
VTLENEIMAVYFENCMKYTTLPIQRAGIFNVTQLVNIQPLCFTGLTLHCAHWQSFGLNDFQKNEALGIYRSVL